MQTKYDISKDQWLRENRWVSFEDVKKAIFNKTAIFVPNLKPWRKWEEVIVFLHNGYPYECAFVKDPSDNEKRFLKTIHKSREHKHYFNL